MGEEVVLPLGGIHGHSVEYPETTYYKCDEDKEPPKKTGLNVDGSM